MSNTFDEHIGYAKELAKRARHKYPSRFWDDIDQAALIGLWKATQRWDGERDFKTYSYFRIIGEITDTVREVDPRPRKNRFTEQQAPQSIKLNPELYVSPINIEKAIVDAELIKRIRKVLPSLISERDYQVFIHYLNVQDHALIATELGISIQISHSIIFHTRRKLKKYLVPYFKETQEGI